MRVRRLGKAVALSVAVPLLLLGISGAASAAKKGTTQWCANHPQKAKKVPACPPGGGGGSGGGSSGGPPPLITVQVDPNPVVETGASVVFAVVQVETSPSYAGASVTISSSQLRSSCADLFFFSDASGAPVRSPTSVSAFLDNDGNVTVLLFGFDCAPGESVVEADLNTAPFLTAVGTLTARPPGVTPAGVSGYPTTSGTVTTGEVETGDTATSGDSNVYAVFSVETDPVYAEQPVVLSSSQLTSRCLRGSVWLNSSGNGSAPTVTGILDDDGNAVFAFMGVSCAAGPSVVIADVGAGFHKTYTGTFSIAPPSPTI